MVDNNQFPTNHGEIELRTEYSSSDNARVASGDNSLSVEVDEVAVDGDAVWFYYRGDLVSSVRTAPHVARRVGVVASRDDSLRVDFEDE